MAIENVDAIVIGAGQAGPSLAVRLAQAGNNTVLLERERLGGTCVNTGCTPTKALVASARVAHLARRAADFGVRAGPDVSVDFEQVRARVHRIVDQSVDGLTSWIGRTERLRLVRAHARFTAPDTIVAGERTLRAPRIFLNVGCRPIVPDWAINSKVPFFTTDTLLALGELPERLVIVGASYVGLEYAQVFRRFGSAVTVVDQAETLLAREDPEAAAEVRSALEGEGVQFAFGASALGLQRSQNGGTAVTFEQHGVSRTLHATHVLLAVGRQPNTEHLGLDSAGISRDARGYIVVDDQLCTSTRGVWAMGDVNGRGAFTHTAWNDYEVVAANLLEGSTRGIAGRVAPYALYVDPPLARIGDNERQARARGGPVLVGFVSMENVGRARERSETRGFMKVLVDGTSMRLLGATLVCADADEVIHSLLNVLAAGIDVRTIAATVPIHPTISEQIPTMLNRLRPL